MCVQPIIKTLPTASKHTGKLFRPVPCGRCPECVKAKINSWLFRLNQELKTATSPLMLLLTYNDANVPRTENGTMTLRKKDCQDFMKRLRFHYAKISSKKIVYYLVGEYGSKYGRPHYHCLMFNMDNPELINPSWSNGITTTPVLRCNNDSGLRYALKYISKPRFKRTDGSEPEFSLMSKGIGANYLTAAVVNFHNRSVVNSSITLPNGIKMPIPKYYKEKMYDKDMRSAVDRFLSERFVQNQHTAAQQLALEKNISIEKAQTNLELSKKYLTFEKRNETL